MQSDRGILSLEALTAFFNATVLDPSAKPSSYGLYITHLTQLIRENLDVDLLTVYTRLEGATDQVGANQRHALRRLAAHQGIELPGRRGSRKAFGGRPPQPVAVALSALNLGRLKAIPKHIAEQMTWLHLVRRDDGKFVLDVQYDLAARKLSRVIYPLTPMQLGGLLWLRGVVTERIGRSPGSGNPIFCSLPDGVHAGPLEPASHHVFRNYPSDTSRWPAEYHAAIETLAQHCERNNLASDTEEAQAKRRALQVAVMPHGGGRPKGARPVPVPAPAPLEDPYANVQLTLVKGLPPPVFSPATRPAGSGPLGAGISDDGGPEIGEDEYDVPELAPAPPRLPAVAYHQPANPPRGYTGPWPPIAKPPATKPK